MQDPDPSTENLPLTGRHRAAPLGLRRPLLRLTSGAGALLLVAALAVLTASWTGLTDPAPDAAGPVHAPAPSTGSATPTSGRTLDLDATRADRPTTSSPTSAPPPVAESAAPIPAGDPAPPPVPAPPPPAPAPPPVVERGEPCSVEGARGTTAAGKPAVCVAKGGETLWRPPGAAR